MKTASMAISLALLALVLGCAEVTPGTSRSLGEVSFERAFEVSRIVLRQYYSIETDTLATGLIVCRPEFSTATSDRLLGTTPSRELAKLQLRRERRGVTAYVQIALQRQMLTAQRELAEGRPYSGVPDNTPSETTAATTFQQNEAWNTVRYDHQRENLILDDIANALRHRATTQPPKPTTQPTQPARQHATTQPTHPR